MIFCPQKFQSPLILDDTYEFAEAVGLSIAREFPSSRLVSSDIEAAVLSMSRYEKSPNPHVKGKSSFRSLCKSSSCDSSGKNSYSRD